jgi:capsular polysaccharide transport system ATP-binding protein
LIHLVAIAKSFPQKGGAPKVLFRPVTGSVPADRRVAILGKPGNGKTTLLRLLSKTLAPDQGEVIAALRCSPVVNSGGLFHPRLTVFDNIRFITRVFGLDVEPVTLAAMAICGVEEGLEHPLRTLPPMQRKALEAAVTIVLPFDCYLFDHIGQMPAETVERCFDEATQRRAGMIFATSNPRLVRQFADFVVVINDTTLYPFPCVKEAIAYFDQQK